MTHPRELEDDELIEITKQLENPEYFGESKAFYKLYNTKMGAVFYFENQERSRSIECQFEMELENLQIMDEPQGAKTFKFRLAPGENTVKLLKPIEPDEQTGI